MSFTIGSLFDGSGGFPLAATMCGGTPKWASEVEPYPIAVTKSRFPGVKHLGSVTDINGGKVDPVDVITFGSPCQDLSVAGKRAGLKHTDNGDDETTRSGLFMEAVRIIKEMREATNGVYPRFAVWENVPGAFSSNKGEDFRIVLEELIKVVEPTAVMPQVPEKGWPYADSYCGDGWSIAYRVLDAQFWGVPQRRRRIYLVADFRGECAGKVLFEREGLRGYFETSRTPWQTVTGDAEGCYGAADCQSECVIYTRGYGGNVTIDGVSPTLEARAGTGGNVEQIIEDKTGTLRANAGDNQMAVAYGFDHKEQHLFENHSQDSRYKGPLDVCPMPPAQLGTGGNNQPFVVESTLASGKNVAGCLMASGYEKLGAQEMFNGDYTVIEKHPTVAIEGNGSRPSHKGDGYSVSDVMYTLNTTEQHAVAHAEAVSLLGDKVSGTLMARDYKGIGRYDTLGSAVCIPTSIRYIVRRLTPTECARLQGFPDFWGHPDVKTELTDEEYQFWMKVRNTHAAINGKATKEYTRDQMLKWYNGLHTDSSEYKMWGNGIALPNAQYVMQGIADVMSEEKVARKKWLDDLLGDCL
jgi:DNA (cytosine-5)-methyltransferase 1